MAAGPRTVIVVYKGEAVECGIAPGRIGGALKQAVADALQRVAGRTPAEFCLVLPHEFLGSEELKKHGTPTTVEGEERLVLRATAKLQQQFFDACDTAAEREAYVLAVDIPAPAPQAPSALSPRLTSPPLPAGSPRPVYADPGFDYKSCALSYYGELIKISETQDSGKPAEFLRCMVTGIVLPKGPYWSVSHIWGKADDINKICSLPQEQRVAMVHSGRNFMHKIVVRVLPRIATLSVLDYNLMEKQDVPDATPAQRETRFGDLDNTAIYCQEGFFPCRRLLAERSAAIVAAAFFADDVSAEWQAEHLRAIGKLRSATPDEAAKGG
eukprot:m51a1_g12663 hypothetical protein (326) ;mRNA; f:1794-3767